MTDKGAGGKPAEGAKELSKEEKAKEGADIGKDIVVELDSKEQALLEYGQKQFEKWLKKLMNWFKKKLSIIIHIYIEIYQK